MVGPVLLRVNTAALRKYKFLEYLSALMFVIPYMEVGVITDLTYKKNDLYFPFIIVLMSCFMSVILFFKIISMGKNKKLTIRGTNLKIIIALKLMLDIYLLVRGVLANDAIKSLVQLSYMSIPFYFSLVIVLLIVRRELNVKHILKIGVAYFTLYCLICFLYNMLIYKNNLFTTVSSRLITPGGGPVILGYTIVVVASILFVINERKTHSVLLYGQFLILFLVSLATGSRGSMWPMSLLIILYVIYNKQLHVKIVMTLFLISFILVINPFAFLMENIPRFGLITSSSRINTINDALIFFSGQSLGTILLGFGVGNFFPYQKWQILFDQYTSNVFYYEGYLLLVQPHNAFIYMLLEGGIIGLLLFTGILAVCIKKCLSKHLPLFKSGAIPILLLCVMCFSDSLLIIHPGPCAQLWFIVLLLVCLKNQKISQDKIILDKT